MRLGDKYKGVGDETRGLCLYGHTHDMEWQPSYIYYTILYYTNTVPSSVL